MPNDDVILRFDNVIFEYEERKPVLDEVSFGVRRGSKITLMGQNGAGKSTIFKLIKGELKPTKGSVFITNNATIATALQVIDKKDLNLIVEEYFSKAFTSVPGNIKSRINTAMAAVNLDVPTDRKVGDLSGGQQQRVFIARALVAKPKILILDEPTAGVDSKAQERFYALLHQLHADFNLTLVLVSHDLDLVAKATTVIACVNQSLLYCGSPTVFKDNRIIEQVYGFNVKRIHHQHHA